jgi:hypothetical protein
MKLSTAQRSAMLALDRAGGLLMTSYELRVRLVTLDALVTKGLAVCVEQVLFKLTPAGRAWCKTNFTDVLNGMINEAEK